jgi:hypothetical protein
MGFAFAILGIFTVIVVTAYRRQLHTEEERESWGRYYLSSDTRAILNGGEKFVLLSVDPVPRSLMGEFGGALEKEKQLPTTDAIVGNESSDDFHDHRVLGRIEIKDSKRKEELLAALYRSVEKVRGTPPACFNPRHAIIAVAGTNRVELLICFECDQGIEFSDLGEKWFLIGKEPSELFNRTLVEAGFHQRRSSSH